MFRQFITPLIVSIIIGTISSPQASSSTEEDRKIQARIKRFGPVTPSPAQPKVNEERYDHSKHQQLLQQKKQERQKQNVSLPFIPIHTLRFKNETELRDLSFLRAFQGLTSLTIDDCSNIGSSIHLLGELTTLTKLTIRDTWKETAPHKLNLQDIDFVKNLKNLKCLILAHHMQLRSIQSLTQLSQLEYLSLASCDGIQDLHLLGQITQLKGLGLCGVFYPQTDKPQSVDFLSPLVNLTSLDLSYGLMLEDISPVWKLTNLKALNVDFIGNCRGVVDGLHKLINIEELSLGDLIYGFISSDFRNLPRLRVLQFREGHSYLDKSLIPRGIIYGECVSMPLLDWDRDIEFLWENANRVR